MTVQHTPEKDRQKVVAAILAGVSTYMEEESAQATRFERQRPAVAVNMWSMAGREEMMRMRTLWQRRIV